MYRYSNGQISLAVLVATLGCRVTVLLLQGK